MDSAILVVLVIIGAIAFIIGAAYLLEYRTKTKGPLFTQPASPLVRIVAFVLGLIFSGFSLVQVIFSGRLDIITPLLAVALVAYGLGADRLLLFLQSGDWGLVISEKTRDFRQRYYTLNPGEITGVGNRVHRVIIETVFKGHIIIVACFEDGTLRAVVGDRVDIIGKDESFPEECRVDVLKLFQVAQSFADKMPLEKERLFPRQYCVTYALVTEGGVRAMQESISKLETEKSLIHPMWVASKEFLVPLWEFLVS